MRLTLISSDASNPRKGLYRCECGTEKVFWKSNVRLGHSMSCGCLRKEVTSGRSIIHGHKSGGSRSHEYVVWMNMISRCSNPANKAFKHYGARGITVSDEWKSFAKFYADMGDCQEGLTLERVDNSKGYSVENCRWASRTDQARNKRDNVNLTFHGETKTLSEWAREVGVRRLTLSYRIRSGWPVDRALEAPVRRMS